MGKQLKFFSGTPGWSGKAKLSGLVLMLLVLAGSCVENLQEEEMDALLLSSSGYGVSDAAHGGEEGFYFLPPMVPSVDFHGEFDPKLSPVVEISSDFSFNRIHASFTMGTRGPDGIRVTGNHYHVNWSAGRTRAEAGQVYRVRVRLGSEVLGYADVAVVRNGREHVRDGLIRLNANQTLPIKFRIEKRERQMGMRIVLTWDPVLDLDAHLTGPIPSSSERFHVYYGNMGEDQDLFHAYLVNDDVEGYRGETVLISRTFTGIYRFSVHNYEHSYSDYNYNLSMSNARVRVYVGDNEVADFSVPEGDGTLWTVFELDGSTREITPINRLSYRTFSWEISRLMPETLDSELIFGTSGGKK